MKSAPRSLNSIIRRRAPLLIICLLLGSFTTVLIAWALTFDLLRATEVMKFAWYTTPNDRDVMVSRSRTLGVVSLHAAIPSRDVGIPDDQWTTVESFVPNWSRRELLDWASEEPEPPLSPGAARAIFITGWPVPCMWSSYDQQPSPNYWWFKARNGIRIGDAPAAPNYTPLSPRERVLPTRIVWPAFLINTVLFSLIWAALLLTPRALRLRPPRVE